MPSPFPGMDPWLEATDLFPSLHDKLAIYLTDALNDVLPSEFVATTRSRVWIEDDHMREPDVSVYGGTETAEGGAVALAGLIAVDAVVSDPLEESFIEIVSARGKRLITAIEIISLTNKRAGEMGREAYAAKQLEYRRAGVNLVEIDLLRRGPHVSAVPEERLRHKVGSYDYHISVRTGRDRKYYVAPILLENPLPAIGIPLDREAAPVTINLQLLLDRAYDTGRYRQMIDYSQPPDPALSPEREAWAVEVLRVKALQ